MPIYDYACTSCGHVTEVIHGIQEQGPRFCPSCGRDGTLKKTFAAPAVHFKGSGWAKKDRKATSSPAKSQSPGSKEPSSSGTAEGSAGSSGSSAGSSESGGASSGEAGSSRPKSGGDD